MLGENVTSINVVFTFDFLWFFLFLSRDFFFSSLLFLDSVSMGECTHYTLGALSIRYKCENIHEYLLCNSFVYSVSNFSFFLVLLFLFLFVVFFSPCLWLRSLFFENIHFCTWFLWFWFVNISVFLCHLMTCWMCSTMTIKPINNIIMHRVALWLVWTVFFSSSFRWLYVFLSVVFVFRCWFFFWRGNHTFFPKRSSFVVFNKQKNAFSCM